MGVKEAAAAAREQIKAGAITPKLAEPAIAESGGAVVPQAGAGKHEGERSAQAAPVKDGEVEVTFLEDEEVEEALEQEEAAKKPPAKPAEKPAAQPDEDEGEAEGEEQEEGEEDRPEGEQVERFTLPGVRDGQDPLEVDIDDPEVVERLRALTRGGIRRQQLAAAMKDVETREEHVAQFEDALRIDPVSVVAEHTSEKLQADLGVFLYGLQHVQDAIREAYGDSLDDPAAFRGRALEMQNQRLQRRGATLETLNERSNYRERSREVRNGIAQIIPEDMDQETATMLAKDLETDVTQWIIAHPQEALRLRVTDLPNILERRLALHGITAEQAAERLEETGLAPLPVRARAGAKNAPARKPQQTARTGEQLVKQADRRRRAGAVPGSGAGVPAAGAIVLPKKQGVKSRIASLREFIGI